jgi:hypothetical protein
MSEEAAPAFNDTFPIEKYAVLTENAPELQARLHHWFATYLPTTPGEAELLSLAVMSSALVRRTQAALTESVNDQIRTAQYRHDCGQEDEVIRLQQLLEDCPGESIKGLERTALGCRFMIARYERLLTFLKKENTLFGNDRDELIRFQGARPDVEHLSKSETAYLTRLFCLAIRANTTNEDYVDLHEQRGMPEAMKDRETFDWVGSPQLCHEYLEALIQRGLAGLRGREATLRTEFEEPARAGAETRQQVVTGPLGRDFLNQSRTHQLNFARAYALFTRGRKESSKLGRPSGTPDPEFEGTPITTHRPEPAELTEGAAAVESTRAARTVSAAGLAPKPDQGHGIGLPNPSADLALELVEREKPLSDKDT